MKPYVSRGNTMMKIPTFSLPAVVTCPGSTQHCIKYCYAKKAEKQYPSVIKSRTRNLKETQKDSFVKHIDDIIKRRKLKYFRIHESGDFYNQGYLDKWILIALRNPNVKFLAYTQMYNLDYSYVPENITIYFSVWDDSKGVPKDGLKAYVTDDGNGKIHNNGQVCGYVCRKTRSNGCDTCLYCFEGRGNVLFTLH